MPVTRDKTERPHGALLQPDIGFRCGMHRMVGTLEARALAFVEWTLGYHPYDIGILTSTSESRWGTLSGGQFDWGGRLQKSNGGVQRFALLERKSSERVQTQKRA